VNFVRNARNALNVYVVRNAVDVGNAVDVQTVTTVRTAEIAGSV
jgi:hypothetical protein